MLEEEISSALQQTVRAASILGTNDLAFHRSLDPQFSTQLDDCLKRLLGITNSLLQYTSEEDFSLLEENEDVDTRWGDIIDIVDSVLEQTDASLEELTAKNKKDKEEAAALKQAKAEKQPLPANLRNAQDLPHPQLKFTRKPDNTDAPWTPLLVEKVNALLPLSDSLTRVRNIDGFESVGHPYSYEIENIQYPDFMFEAQSPIMYKDVKSTSPTWVDDSSKLLEMLQALKQSREIAIDLEHHDFHSFRGFVCLMQVSNREQDWIVDTLQLRDELIVLNEVFTDPAILKVFHGAASDIIWLQRDFGLYIVNLFDTYHASKALGLQGHGLAFLLSKYVDFEADKRYQLADWRIRPLPKEMLYYARSDTHYLLYVYDIMRNELLDKSDEGTHNVLASVLQASAGVSLRQYTKEPYDAAQGQGSDGWQFLLNRFYGTRAFGPQQLEVMKALHQWRDQKAREIDESTRFVMPNQTIVSIAAAMPKDLNALLVAHKQVSSTMQKHLQELLDLIQLAIKHANAQNDEVALAPANPQQTIEVPRELPEALPIVSRNKKALPEPDSLISSHSLFWGPLKKSLRFITTESPLKDLRLSVPLPPLADSIYVPQSSTTVNNVNAVEESKPKLEKLDEVFIVKDLSRQQAAKRKSEVLELDNVVQDDVRSAIRRDRKQAKEEKRAQKVEAASASQTSAVSAFDYAAQPSLLQEKEKKKIKARKFGEFSGKLYDRSKYKVVNRRRSSDRRGSEHIQHENIAVEHSVGEFCAHFHRSDVFPSLLRRLAS